MTLTTNQDAIEPIDAILNKLFSSNKTDPDTRVVHLNTPLEPNDLYFLCDRSQAIFAKEPMLLRLAAPMKIVGDVHGQFEDVLRILKSGKLPDQSNYLFLGDYVDRGPQSIETISILLALKIKFPQNVFMLRGNHECTGINRQYGFLAECTERFGVKLWRRFNECFNYIPVSAVLEKSIFCTHGGISPYLNKISDVLKLRRPAKVPDEGLLCDLLWSDPQKDIAGWRKNQRGTSYVFGQDVLDETLDRLGISLLVRAHQLVKRGIEFHGMRKIITVFSAPNYVSGLDNWGAYINLDSNLRKNFVYIQPRKTEGAESVE